MSKNNCLSKILLIYLIKLSYDLYSFLSPRYEYLDRFVRRRYQPSSFKFVASKVAVDGLIPPLVFGGAFSIWWPAVQIANFRFIPVRYQVLYGNLFCQLGNCFRLWIGDADWKVSTSFHKKIED